MEASSGFEWQAIDSGDLVPCSKQELACIFADCNDVKGIVVESVEEVRALTEVAWAHVRAIRLFLLLLDFETPDDELPEVAETLEELLLVPGVAASARNDIFAAPLPQPIDAKALSGILSMYPNSAALFRDLLTYQSAILRVSKAFDEIPDELFGMRDTRDIFREHAIENGSFKALVMAIDDPESVDRTLYDLYLLSRDLENYRSIINAWGASFHKSAALSEKLEDDSVAGWLDEPEPVFEDEGWPAYRRAMAQVEAIVARIKAGDHSNARRFVIDLINDQSTASTPAQLAKSLTNISHKAKFHNLELAREWAQRAVELQPDDGMTYAELADILIRLEQFDEARQNLTLAESFGESLFAANARAKILRSQRQFRAALDAYQKALLAFEDDPEIYYTWAGIAECERDLELPDEALRTYDRAIAHFPENDALHSGRAATLVDLGKFDEAEESYQKALMFDDEPVVELNGLAQVYLQRGELVRAEAAFRRIIDTYPFDQYAYHGLCTTLRTGGLTEEAVEVARDIVMRFPHNGDSYWSLGDALSENGELDEAYAVFSRARIEYPYMRALHIGLARVERARGRYDAALRLLRETAVNFPSSPRVDFGIADILRRMGRIDEAMRIYFSAVERFPHRLALRNGLASIYIFGGRFSEAQHFLSVEVPRSTDEWRNFFLHAALEERQQNLASARVRYEWGSTNCPFARERRKFSAALARLDLMERATSKTGWRPKFENFSRLGHDPTDLLMLHISAVGNDQTKSRYIYKKVKEIIPDQYRDVMQEIGLQFGIIPGKSLREEGWIFEREAEMLLLEAA